MADISGGLSPQYLAQYSAQRQSNPGLNANPWTVSQTINGQNYNPAGDLLGAAQSGAPAPAAAPSGGGGGSAAQANPLSQYLSPTMDVVGRLNNVYGQIFGQIGQDANRQAQNAQSSYQNQSDNLTNQFTQNSRQLPWMFASRGTAGSTDYGNALNDATTNYNTGAGNLKNTLESALQGIAGWAGSNKSQYSAQQDYVNRIKANPQSYLSPYLPSTLENQYQQASGFLGQLGNSAQLNSQLGQYLPSDNSNGVSNLQGQLSKLAGTPIPQQAQNAVAGNITSNPQLNNTNQGYWQNYWNQLQGNRTP